jgi:hypothetical protein
MSRECLYLNLPLGCGNNVLTELVGMVSYFSKFLYDIHSELKINVLYTVC